MKNITINPIGVELNEKIEEYLLKKLRSLKKFIDFEDESVVTDIRLIKETNSRRSGNLYRTEIGITTVGKKYGAKGEGEELLASIDAMKDAVSKKIASHKGKKQILFRKGATKVKGLLRREIKS